MAKLSYTEQTKDLIEVIDIAIESIKKFPPEGFENNDLNHFENVYLNFRNKALNPEPAYKNSHSFGYLKNDVLIYFQEGTGDAIDYFWKQIKDRKLGYERKNNVSKILKRRKIKNKIEYDFVMDVIVPYQQEGLINEFDVNQLNQMVLEFETKLEKKRT